MREEIFTLKLPAAKAPEFLHGITPNDFLAVAGDVETLSGSFHRGLTQRGRDPSGMSNSRWRNAVIGSEPKYMSAKRYRRCCAQALGALHGGIVLHGPFLSSVPQSFGQEAGSA